MRHLRSLLYAGVIISIILSITGCQAPAASSSPTNTPNAEARSTAQAFVEKNKFGYGLTGDPKYGALAIHQNGEQLVAMTEMTNGKITKVTGTIWSHPDKGTVVAYCNEDGLPEKVFYKDTFLLMSNYTEKTVDIAIVAADGSVRIERGVALDPEKLSRLKQVNREGNFKLAKPVYGTPSVEISLSKAITLASWIIGVIACVHAVGLGLLPIVVLCGSLLLNVAAEVFPNDPLLSTLNTYMDRYGCVISVTTLGKYGAPECTQALLGITKEVVEKSKKQEASIEEARAALKDSAKKNEIVIKDISPTPVTPTKNPYGCDNPKLTPEEKAHCGKHKYNIELDSTKITPACESRNFHQTYVLEDLFSFDDAGILIGSCNKIDKNTYNFCDKKEDQNSFDGAILMTEQVIKFESSKIIIIKWKKEWIPNRTYGNCREVDNISERFTQIE